MKINNNELKKLFNELKNHNDKGFEKLYTNYNNLVYKIAFSILKNKEDSEDVVQTVFTKIYKLDKSKLPCDKESSWLYMITKNETITLIRKKKDTIDFDSIYEIEDQNNELRSVIDKDNYNRLISKLNDDEKEIISLKILADLSFSEIAKLLNKPIGTVKWKYYKAISTLKILLSNLGMFIITFVVGLKMINYTKTENIQSDNVKENLDKSDNEELQNKKETENFSNTVGSLVDEDIISESNEINTIIEDETNSMSITENITEILDISDNLEEDINYYGVGILSISGIFFIITIIFTIFFIKYQLNKKEKASK